jgi:hypothetical protein
VSSTSSRLAQLVEYRSYEPKAVGCCHYSLDNTIYGCGDHAKYTNKYKCIIDYKTPCWVITDSNFGDENRFSENRKYNYSTNLIKKFFPHIKLK